MARISLSPPKSVAYRLAQYSRRKFGTVLDPARALGHHPGVKIRAVPNWRDSDLFTDTERLTLEYAEAVTATPPEVTGELVARLRTRLDDAQLIELIELTEVIALENVRARVNSAFGLASQGFAERCEVSR